MLDGGSTCPLYKMRFQEEASSEGQFTVNSYPISIDYDNHQVVIESADDYFDFKVLKIDC